MVKLLVIADDFTGALDTGVQFAARGAVTSVVTDPAYAFTQTRPDIQVLVLDAETRHIPPDQAYSIVFHAVRNARKAGISYIYKKTDSALRGNIGSELTAAMDGAGVDSIPFIPAFPKMGRVTRRGVHYIDGVPVAESVFGQDPFEPVKASDLRSILAEQSDAAVIFHEANEQSPAEQQGGIQVFNAVTDEDLLRIGRQLDFSGLQLSAGCAGFAAVLAEILELEGSATHLPALVPTLFVVCGSVNPVTRQQLDTAERRGFPRTRLSPAQKLTEAWLESDACTVEVQKWLDLTRREHRCILDANDPDGGMDTQQYADCSGLTTEQLRVQISTVLGKLMKRLLDSGLDATLMCTGGDTLLALMRAVGVSELMPVCELAAGTVLTSFLYQEKIYHIISKSGGFGEADLLCKLAALTKAGK